MQRSCATTLLRAVPAVAAVRLLATPAFAQPEGVVGYEAIQVLPLLDDDYARVIAISDHAWIAVESVGGITAHPSAWVNGILYELPTPAGYETPRISDAGISPTSGIIVGQAYEADRLFVTSPVAWVAGQGVFVLQRLIGFGDCGAVAVNDRGTVLGACYTPVVATLWRRSVVAERLGADESYGSAINRYNEVAGEWNLQPCYWDLNGQMTVLPVADGQATDLNDHLDLVIYEHVDGQGTDGHLWKSGELYELPDPKGTEGLLRPQAINNWGQIVGYGSSNRGDYPAAALWWGEFGENVIFLQDHIGPERPTKDFELGDAFDINNAGQIIASGGTIEVPGPFLLTPYNFNLGDPVPGTAGQVNTIEVTGLQPGQKVRLAAGFKPGAQCLPNSSCLGGLLLIQNLKGVLPPITADNSGTATFIVNVPASLRGQALRLQAYDKDNCQISHTVEWEFQ